MRHSSGPSPCPPERSGRSAQVASRLVDQSGCSGASGLRRPEAARGWRGLANGFRPPQSARTGQRSHDRANERAPEPGARSDRGTSGLLLRGIPGHRGVGRHRAAVVRHAHARVGRGRGHRGGIGRRRGFLLRTAPNHHQCGSQHHGLLHCCSRYARVWHYAYHEHHCSPRYGAEPKRSALFVKPVAPFRPRMSACKMMHHNEFRNHRQPGLAPAGRDRPGCRPDFHSRLTIGTR